MTDAPNPGPTDAAPVLWAIFTGGGPGVARAALTPEGETK